MKKFFSILILQLSVVLLFSNDVYSQSVAINSTGNSPDVSAMLDIVSSTKGLLLPRVSLSSTTDAATIVTPATSLIVYNTNTDITGDYAAGQGFYYNSGTSVSPAWRRLVGDGESRWDDLRVVLDNGTNSAQINYLSGSSGPQIWHFRYNQGVEAMSFNVQLPHAWKEGTTIFPHLHWIPKSGISGNVEWNFEYTWANYDPVTQQVFPAITTSTVVSSGPFTANTHQIQALTSDNTGIAGTGKKISSILICRLWRNSSNAADTYNADAGVLFVDFHIQIDSWGSRQEYIK